MSGFLATSLPAVGSIANQVPGLSALPAGVSAPGFTGSSSALSGDVDQQGGEINFGGSGGGANAGINVLGLGLIALAAILLLRR